MRRPGTRSGSRKHVLERAHELPNSYIHAHLSPALRWSAVRRKSPHSRNRRERPSLHVWDPRRGVRANIRLTPGAPQDQRFYRRPDVLPEHEPARPAYGMADVGVLDRPRLKRAGTPRAILQASSISRLAGARIRFAVEHDPATALGRVLARGSSSARRICSSSSVGPLRTATSGATTGWCSHASRISRTVTHGARGDQPQLAADRRSRTAPRASRRARARCPAAAPRARVRPRCRRGIRATK